MLRNKKKMQRDQLQYMASTPTAHQNKKAQTQIEGPIASRLRSHSKEVQLWRQQNEGPIAFRLRSQGKIGDVQTSNTELTGGTRVKNSSDKPSQHSSHKTDKSNNTAAKKGTEVHTKSTNRGAQPSTDKSIKKSNDSTPKSSEGDVASSSGTSLPPYDHQGTKIIKDPNDAQRKQHSKNRNAKSHTTNQNSKNQKPKKMENSVGKKRNSPKPSSSNGQKNKKKTKPSQKPPANSINDRPTDYIRWKGFDTATCWNCALCEKDLACSSDTEECEHSVDEEYDAEHSFSSLMGQEMEQCPLLPEVSVLPCSHVFHSMCLCLCMTEKQPSDLPCPICISLW